MNKIQELQLELIKTWKFNMFDGEKIAADLIAHQEIWRGAITMKFYWTLLPLLGIDKGYWAVDTLYITPQSGCEDELWKLAKTWYADDVHWVGGEEAGAEFLTNLPEIVNNPKVFLLVWWD